MREIKFRAWDREDKVMTTMDNFDFYEDGPNHNEKIGQFFNWHYGCEIMQYTGLKDKNGVEIYEGDIVQIVAENVRYDGTIQEFRSNVFFINGSFSYIHDDGFDYPLDGVCSESGVNHEGSHFAEVIGNIYENPELLEVIA